MKKALDAKRRLVIADARPPSDWLNLHITGAISTPYYDTKSLDDIPNDGTWVLAYCACPHHVSGIVVEELRGAATSIRPSSTKGSSPGSRRSTRWSPRLAWRNRPGRRHRPRRRRRRRPKPPSPSPARPNPPRPPTAPVKNVAAKH